MGINTDYRNMAPNPLHFNRGNPLAVPSRSAEPQQSTPVSSRPASRRDQISSARQSSIDSARVRQAASHQVYNSQFGQTTFVRGGNVGSTVGVDRTTGLTQHEQEQVANDVKSGPVLPNTVLGLDASEQAVGAIFAKIFKDNPDLDKQIGDIAGNLATVYRDIGNQRKAANAPKATGPMTFRTAGQQAAKANLNIEDRLSSYYGDLSSVMKESSHHVCKNMSANFFLLIMEGIRDAQEFRMQEVELRQVMDKLKLRAKDLAIAKLEQNFAVEEGAALATAINSTNGATSSLVKKMTDAKNSEVGEKAAEEKANNGLQDSKDLDGSRDAMLSAAGPDEWKTALTGQANGDQRRLDSNARQIDAWDSKLADAMDKNWPAYLEANRDRIGEGVTEESLKGEFTSITWNSFVSDQTSAGYSAVNGQAQVAFSQFKADYEAASTDEDKERLLGDFKAKVGNDGAKKFITGDESLAGKIDTEGFPTSNIDQESIDAALTGDDSKVRQWVAAQKRANVPEGDIEQSLKGALGEARTANILGKDCLKSAECQQKKAEILEAKQTDWFNGQWQNADTDEKKQDLVGKFTKMVGTETARKLLATNEEALERVPEKTISAELGQHVKDALSGDVSGLKEWIQGQIAAGRGENPLIQKDVYLQVANLIGPERASQIVHENLSDAKAVAAFDAAIKEEHNTYEILNEDELKSYNSATRAVPGLQAQAVGQLDGFRRVNSEDAEMRMLGQMGVTAENYESVIENNNQVGNTFFGRTVKDHVEAKKVRAKAEAAVEKATKKMEKLTKAEAQEKYNLTDEQATAIYGADGELAFNKAEAEKVLNERPYKELTEKPIKERLALAAGLGDKELKKTFKLSDEELDLFKKGDAVRLLTAKYGEDANSAVKHEENLAKRHDELQSKLDIYPNELQKAREAVNNDATLSQAEKDGKLAEIDGKAKSLDVNRKRMDASEALKNLEKIGGDVTAALNEAIGQFQSAATVGTDLAFSVGTYTQQHQDSVASAQQAIARMYAAMKMAFR